MEVLFREQDRQPCALRSRMVFATCSTMTGASPSDGSSSSMVVGLPISVRAMVSICCSPPLIKPPSRSLIAARLGNNAKSLSCVHSGAFSRRGWRPTSRFSATVRLVNTRRSSGYVSQSETADLERFQSLYRLPLEGDLALRGSDQADDRLDRRRLACAVAAEQRHDFASTNLERNFGQDLRPTVEGVDTGQLEDLRARRHGHESSTPCTAPLPR